MHCLAACVPGSAPPSPRTGRFGVVRFEKRGGKYVAVKRAVNGDDLHHEAALLRTLRHPHIPAFVAYRKGAITMESVGRQTLTDVVLDAPPGTERDARCHRACVCAASALAYVHARGVVHGDVKCDNVVVNAAGEGFLIDYNLACYAPVVRRAGTARYMAPEMFVERAWDGYGADVWSFGVLYFAVLFEWFPFQSGNACVCPRVAQFVQAADAEPATDVIARLWKEEAVRTAHGAARRAVLNATLRTVPATRMRMERVHALLLRAQHVHAGDVGGDADELP